MQLFDIENKIFHATVYKNGFVEIEDDIGCLFKFQCKELSENLGFKHIKFIHWNIDSDMQKEVLTFVILEDELRVKYKIRIDIW